MAAGRKLQAEIEKVLKKVEEGIEEFNNVWDNVHSATHANQREKFEAELKTQIKKLQRDREQIKSWQSDKSIKDKNSLADARKKIEVEMERFKEFERDAKTKTYSKEGLSKSDKVDPHEEERRKHREWIQDSIDSLNQQVDEMEAEFEAQGVASTKKGKTAKQESPGDVHLRHVQETHRWHITKMEQLLRKLDNDEVDLEELENLKENVTFYVDENSRTEGEYLEFETIYETFGLEEIEDYLAKDKDRRDSESGELEMMKDGDSESMPDKEESGKIPKEKKEEAVAAKAPTKSVKEAKQAAPSPTMRPQRTTSGSEVSEEKPGITQKPWPPMVSVWQNLPPAQPKEAPPPSTAAPPTKAGPPSTAPRPSLPPPMQPAPERPPPPNQSPMLNSPPNQPPPKPAPHAAPPNQAPPNQPPQIQPPTQAPPQPPLPSPPLGSPPRPQGTSVGALPATLSGLVSTTPMPPPPPMAPPAPEGGPGTTPSASTVGSGSLTEPPTSAPPPPPPPLLPPPPPAPAPGSGGPPPSTSPSIHNKIQIAKSSSPAEHEPPSWPPPTPYTAEDRLQSVPKVPPPSEAPPPPTESPPPPPLDGPNANSSGADSLLSEAVGFANGLLAEVDGVLPTGSPSSRAAESGAMQDAGGPLSPRKVQALQLLVASHQHLPLPSDSRRNRKYVPRNPYVHLDTRNSAAYPTHPTRNYDDPAMFEKYDLDTLFFIFYYQQGSYQQHLAAKELKKLSWRYHTKYLTWFQRHEEPRMTASDYERGAYVYFDHETGWCQRIKSDFTFEYQFLEDEPL